MTKEQVQKLRELHGEESLFLFTDNAKLYNAKSEKTHMIWDDANEVVHAIRPHTNYKLQETHPVTVESSAYDTVQYMGSHVSREDLTKILDQLKLDGLIAEDKISTILDEYKI